MTCKKFLILVAVLLFAVNTYGSAMPKDREYTNSLGMKFVRIEPGTFQMGQIKTPLDWDLLPHTGGRGDRMDSLRQGDFDEKPVHTVRISKPIYFGVFEVTNFQYELFDPDHKALRGKDSGLSAKDNDAVVNVSWYEAVEFCRWLSEAEGIPCRLPTEAEWEYACRAGTTTHYFSGDTLGEEYQKNQHETKCSEFVSLGVGETPANAWGLYDMLGNVEEWCLDWYGYYKSGRRVDPVGYIDGQYRVTRGGSHGTQIYSLRSANRMAALPETRNWMTGFRVVIGEMPKGKPLPEPELPLHQQNVIQRNRAEASKGPNPDQPYFEGPRVFVKIPRGSYGPLFRTHNHDPAIVECPNGDLLSMWYTCDSERNRELGQAASRLRKGAKNWDQASEFFDVPGRNDHAPSMGFDGKDTIYHFTGVAHAGEHGCMALAMRTSKDSGATWSKARLAMPEFNNDHMPSEPVLWLKDGTLAFAQDGPHTVWFSKDGGLSWSNPGGRIRGNHPSFVELDDGTFLGLGRSNAIDGMMPKSISTDRGISWTYSASKFPPISGGQRLVLLKLREGPVFFASPAHSGIMITDSSGKQRKVYGIIAAVSFDGGKTWPHMRLVTDDGPSRAIEGMNGGLLTMSQTYSEPLGYYAGCQSLDGVIHLISSQEHYAFNLKWLTTPAPPIKYPPLKVTEVVETFTGPNKFDVEGWHDKKNFTGGFNGKGQFTIKSASRSNGLNRIVGVGSFEALFAVDNLSFNPPDVRTEPHVKVGFRDTYGPSMTVQVMPDKIDEVPLASPPKSAKVKFIWNEKTKQLKIFYGLNGDEPVTEFPRSLKGLYLDTPVTECLSAFILMDAGSVDVDHYEIKPFVP
ncbi:MAG: SUMF1/EgtB/PvdO family nonheme iron enzyme [Planctomycetota bacterium]|jgi:formylglycine-generating enzyme required for sulfatase activity